MTVQTSPTNILGRSVTNVKVLRRKNYQVEFIILIKQRKLQYIGYTWDMTNTYYSKLPFMVGLKEVEPHRRRIS